MNSNLSALVWLDTLATFLEHQSPAAFVHSCVLFLKIFQFSLMILSKRFYFFGCCSTNSTEGSKASLPSRYSCRQRYTIIGWRPRISSVSIAFTSNLSVNSTTFSLYSFVCSTTRFYRVFLPCNTSIWLRKVSVNKRESSSHVDPVIQKLDIDLLTINYSHKEKILRLSVQASSSNIVDKLRADIEEKGLTAELLNSNAVDNKFQARLRISMGQF